MYSTWTKEHVMSFVAAYGQAIIEAITDSGIFFPAFVGQVYVESRDSKGDGLSKLALNYNNFGGIKTTDSGAAVPYANGTVDSLSGEGSRAKGTYYKEVSKFVTFPSPKDSFLSHVAILKHDIYVNAGVFTADTPEEQILRIAEAGYTTNSPKEYLRLIQGSLDASRDIYKLGRIVSQAAPVADATTNGAVAGSSNLLDQIRASTSQTLADALKLFGGTQ